MVKQNFISFGNYAGSIVMVKHLPTEQYIGLILKNPHYNMSQSMLYNTNTCMSYTTNKDVKPLTYQASAESDRGSLRFGILQYYEDLIYKQALVLASASTAWKS
jgi:hypothetical protein